MVHDLKTWPLYFAAVSSGKKTFEIRKNDRDFKVGDILILKEFIPCKQCDGGGRVMIDPPSFDKCCDAPHGKYTGRIIRVKVRYCFDSFGLDDGYIAMSFKKCK